MAGPGIRAWETARVLSAQQPVTLIAPQPIDLPATAFALGSYAWGTPGALDPWLQQTDVVLANGFVLLAHPELATTRLPLALDLYDPVLLEDLETTRSAPPAKRTARNALMRDLLQRQLAAGDFFVCATERQRDLYIGALMHAGRLTPDQINVDPRLRDLIDLAPFGLPVTTPARNEPALRNVIPGIGANDAILLWAGGLWDWLDPLTLIEAMPLVATRHPDVRLVFLAGRHPGMVDPMQVAQLARIRATELGLLNSHIFFYEEWVPYERRADFLLDADLAVSLHRDHLETAYAAVRSRFLDHLWAGLASVVTAGDAAAELVQRHRLGRVAPPQDVAGVAQALLELLDDPRERLDCATRAQMLAAEYTWERALQPLARFCGQPRRSRAMPASRATPSAPIIQPDAEKEHLMESYTRFRAAVATLHTLWRIEPQEPGSALPLVGKAKHLANTLIRWYVGPLVEQQNAFNAATVNAVQALADTVERLAGEHAPLRQHVADIEQHLLDIDDAQTSMARRLAD